MNKRLWVLGAPDPEMESIERLLAEAGEAVVYAIADGIRVHGGNAYRCDPVPDATHWVECSPVGGHNGVVIDHHRPGDPGYGRQPAEFLAASSIGQVITELARTGCLPKDWGQSLSSPDDDGADGFDLCSDSTGAWWRHGITSIPYDVVLCAAADHCLAAAYRGECPGVDPDDLMRWRAESRAVHQGRSVGDVLADVERARAVLRDADYMLLDNVDQFGLCHGCGLKVQSTEDDEDWDYCECPIVRDMRGQHVPELPEASAREGLCFVADGLPGPDGRVKVVCQSGTPEQIRAFMEVWAPANGLQDIYGDPARGFAGGYI